MSAPTWKVDPDLFTKGDTVTHAVREYNKLGEMLRATARRLPPRVLWIPVRRILTRWADAHCVTGHTLHVYLCLDGE